MKHARHGSRKGFLALSLAVLAATSSQRVFANITVTYEQNANGQAYSYTAPNGATINGNFPSDNNWSQSLTYGEYGYSVGMNNFMYPYENAPSNWSIDTYPNSTSDDIVIPGVPVTLDVSVSIGNLNISSGGSINMNNGQSLTIAGASIIDNGSINVNPGQSGGQTILNINSGTVSGTGAFALGYSGTNAQLNGILTQSAGHTIKGEGQINAALTNNGTVNANFNAGILYLQTSNMTNNSLFESTNGGTLEIDNINIAQPAAGLIAIGTGSGANLNGANISGGTLNSAAGTFFTDSGNTTTLNSLTSNAAIHEANGSIINLAGNIVDNGQILVNPTQSGGATILNVSGGTVSGTGSFLLNYSTTNAQLNGSLNQSAGHSILGQGEVNALLINNGSVNANASGQTLFVQTLSPTATDTNSSIFEATSGGTLQVNGITVNQGTNGVMNAASGSTVNLTNSTVNGGALNAANNSTMVLSNSVVSAATLTGASGAVIYVQGAAPSSIGSVFNNPVGSYVNVVNGCTLNITGTLVDNGEIAVNPGQAGGTTVLNFAGGTITGSGVIYLGYSTTNAQLNGTLTQPAGHTISGEGYVNAALTNLGTVNANYSGGILYLQTNNMSNSGLFEATGGGTLYINQIGVAQPGAGQILAGTNSPVYLNTATISGGLLNSSTGSPITVTGNGTTTLASVTNNATLNVLNGNGINVTGNLPDNGTININPLQSGGTTFMNMSGGTLSGTGSVVLGYSTNNAQLNGSLTQSAAHTIKGEGQINAALTNNGTVDASSNGQILYLQTSNMSNNSLFEATYGGTLEIDNINVTQSASALIAIGIASGVNLNGANISGGTLTSSTSTYFSAAGNITTLASLTSNAAIRLASGSVINLAGNIVDNGQILVNPTQSGGATILNVSGGTVSGTGSFLLNYSTTNAQLDGSLNQSAGHSILGQGEMNALLINNGTVNANASGQTLFVQTLSSTATDTNNSIFEATLGGTLQVTGITVNQGTNGVMNAASGSTVNLTNSVVNGGALNAANNSSMVLSDSVVSAATVTGASGAVIYVQGNAPSSISTVLQNPTGSLINIVAGSTLNITGTLVDNGEIAVNPAQSGGVTILNFSGATITGSGVFYLGYSTTDAQLNGTLTQPAGHTISGEGYVNAALTNNGTVNANYSGGILYLQNNNMSNSGLFEATGGGTLYINQIGVTQSAAAQILAGTGSVVDLNAVTVSGGSLNSSTGAAIYAVGGTTTLASITNDSQLNQQNVTTLNVTGNLVDNGQIAVNYTQSGGVTILNFNGGTVSGTGSILLNYSTSNAQLNGMLTQSAGHTIKGEGQINAALTNNGTVNANTLGQVLYINNSVANTGTFESTNGGYLEITAGTVTSSAGSTVTGNITVDFGAQLTETGAVAGAPAITDSGVVLFGANPGSGILNRTLTSLAITTTGSATITSASNHVNRTILTTGALTFAGNTNNWSGKLEAGNNDIDVQNGVLGDLTNQIKQGFNSGTWQGSAGITSSTAAADTKHLTALGIILNGTTYGTANGSLGTFDGTNPNATDVLIKYTYFGDANLDGKVDGSDYTKIDSGFITHATGWSNGDFNYDGVINGSDYTLIDNAFNTQGTNLTNTAEIATASSQLAGTSAVPEPTSTMSAVLGSSCLLSRRRRRAYNAVY